MRMIGVALPPQPQLVVVVQPGQAAIRIGQVLEMLLGRRTGRGVVEGRREIGRLKVGLRQLVLHGGGGGGVVQTARRPTPAPTRRSRPVTRRTATKRQRTVRTRRQSVL